MIKLISYPLTCIYFLFFGLTLVIFHPIQWVSFNLFGYKAHKISVDIMNFCLMHCLFILGTRVSFKNVHSIETDQPLIIVSNHQSMYDISPLSWYFRKYHPKFISKKSLGKGIPSVSFNLRHGGSALIERKNPRQALPEIIKFAESIEKTNHSCVIFPEGTRSTDGHPKKFQTKGLEILLKKIPSAILVPVTINNSWKTVKYGKFPMGIGIHITFHCDKPLKNSNFTDKAALIHTIESTITKNINLD